MVAAKAALSNPPAYQAIAGAAARLAAPATSQARGERSAGFINKKDKTQPDCSGGWAGSCRGEQRYHAEEIEARARSGENLARCAFDRRMVDEVLHRPPRWLISR
jgi:hypothetical protein